MQAEIKNHRRRLGLTQEGLAAQIGCDRSTIACYENGYISPSLNAAKKMAKIFGISLDELTVEEPTHANP